MTFDRRTPGQLRAALAATEELLVNTQKRVERMEPMWAAGHTYCAAELDDESHAIEVNYFRDQMFAVHRATTPSPTSSTHVLISVDELAALREEVEDLRMQCAKDTDELRRPDALDSYGGGA